MNTYFPLSVALVSSALVCMIFILRWKIRELEIQIDNLKKDFQERDIK